MTSQFKSNAVLVLDLDDTLYQEADYVLSGIKHIASLLRRLTGVELEPEILRFYENNPAGDFLDFAIDRCRLTESSKESLLWSYRLHSPEISLSMEVSSWLEASERDYHAIAILTDGRSVTQRLKMEALGLIGLPAYISEDWGGGFKPDPVRFKAIEERWEVDHYIYIGDNPAKDFVTPNRLGWKSIGLKGKGYNVHNQFVEAGIGHAPNVWIGSLEETNSLPLLR